MSVGCVALERGSKHRTLAVLWSKDRTRSDNPKFDPNLDYVEDYELFSALEPPQVGQILTVEYEQWAIAQTFPYVSVEGDRLDVAICCQRGATPSQDSFTGPTVLYIPVGPDGQPIRNEDESLFFGLVASERDLPKTARELDLGNWKPSAFQIFEQVRSYPKSQPDQIVLVWCEVPQAIAI